MLILTKPLGTGIVVFASQIDKASPESIKAINKSMTTLNKRAAELMVEFGAHSCTDVTGFGLMGHLSEMALSSGVDAEVIWDEIPLFPGVLEYAAGGLLPGAIERNRESCGDRIIASEKLPQEMIDICYDAQTSGGLLIAIARDNADNFLKALHIDGITDAAIIGEVTQKGSGRVHIKYSDIRQTPDVIETPKENEREE